MEAGLVDGKKIHADGSLIAADASKDSVVRGPESLIDQLRTAYEAQEKKLTGSAGDPHYQAQNRRLMSTTDPDAPCVRHGKKGGTGDSRPRYKHHRAVDDKCEVITAVETTPGDLEENSRAESLIDQHRETTGKSVETFVADRQYGTVDNYRRLQKRGIRTHMGATQSRSTRHEGIFPTDRFTYDEDNDCYICPAGKRLAPPDSTSDANTLFTRRAKLTAAPVPCVCPARDQRPAERSTVMRIRN